MELQARDECSSRGGSIRRIAGDGLGLQTLPSPLAHPPRLRHFTPAVEHSPETGCRAACRTLKQSTIRPPPSGEAPMTNSTWITMIVVMGGVWGGFASVLLTAVRKESGKSSET